MIRKILISVLLILTIFLFVFCERNYIVNDNDITQNTNGDKLISLTVHTSPYPYAFNTTEGMIIGILPNFNKKFYSKADSIIMVVRGFVEPISYSGYVSLVKMADTTVIENSQITFTSINPQILFTPNLYMKLPEETTNLGVLARINNSSANVFVYSVHIQIFRK